jgi:hypothetical protein
VGDLIKELSKYPDSFEVNVLGGCTDDFGITYNRHVFLSIEKTIQVQGHACVSLIPFKEIRS